MLKVIDININDQNVWEPDDPLDFVVPAVITVGGNKIGDKFYLQLCTPKAVKKLADKHDIFIIEKWESIDDLEKKLNIFIEAKLNENVKDSAFECLDNYWHWEHSSCK